MAIQHNTLWPLAFEVRYGLTGAVTGKRRFIWGISEIDGHALCMVFGVRWLSAKKLDKKLIWYVVLAGEICIVSGLF